MTLIKRNKVFHARLKTTGGKTVSISTKQTDRHAAAKFARDQGWTATEAAAQTHRLGPEGIARILAGKRVTIAKAIPAWQTAMTNMGLAQRTIINSLCIVRQWADQMKLNPLAPINITPEQIREWVNREGEGKASSRQISISVIGRFLQFCTSVGWNMGNQAKGVRINLHLLSHAQKETDERIPFAKSEVNKLLRDLEGFWQFAVRCGYETGLRLNDITQLEWASFDRDGEIIVHTRKTGARIAVPISDELSHMLTTIPVTDTRYIFPEQHAIASDPRHKAGLSVTFKRLCEKAGIEDKSFHCLRHAYVQNHRELGDTWEAIALAVGHACEETTKAYAHKNVGGKKK